jgi:hypothetical protein
VALSARIGLTSGEGVRHRPGGVVPDLIGFPGGL